MDEWPKGMTELVARMFRVNRVKLFYSLLRKGLTSFVEINTNRQLQMFRAKCYASDNDAPPELFCCVEDASPAKEASSPATVEATESR